MPNLPDYDDDQGGAMQIEMVGEQPRLPRRKPKSLRIARVPVIRWHSRFAEPHGLQCVTISVDGARYEYLMLPLAADNAEYLAKHVSAGKAFAYIKRHHKGWIKL